MLYLKLLNLMDVGLCFDLVVREYTIFLDVSLQLEIFIFLLVFFFFAFIFLQLQILSVKYFPYSLQVALTILTLQGRIRRLRTMINPRGGPLKMMKVDLSIGYSGIMASLVVFTRTFESKQQESYLKNRASLGTCAPLALNTPAPSL